MPLNIFYDFNINITLASGRGFIRFHCCLCIYVIILMLPTNKPVVDLGLVKALAFRVHTTQVLISYWGKDKMVGVP